MFRKVKKVKNVLIKRKRNVKNQGKKWSKKEKKMY